MPEKDEAESELALERGALRAFLGALHAFAPRGTKAMLGLSLLLAATEGVGILLLVPFLILVRGAEVHAGGAADLAVRAFEATGLSLSLASVLAVFVVLVALRALLTYASGVVSVEVELGFADRMRGDLFAAMGRSSWRFLAGRRLSDTVQGITREVARVTRGAGYALDLVVDGVLAVVYVLVALTLSWQTTALALGLGALLEVLRWPQIRHARELGRATTAVNRNAFALLQEFVSGLKPIKSRGLEERHREAYVAEIGEIRARRLGFNRSLLRTQVLHDVAVAALLAGLLYVAATVFEVRTAELLVLVFVFARLLPVLTGLHQRYRSMIEMAPSFTSNAALRAEFEAAAEPIPASDSRTIGLERELVLEGVSLRYEGAERPALDGVDLALPVRTTVGIVGPSGAGKSTLADVILGLLAPDAGRLLVDGQELFAADLSAWRRTVAYVPQETFLLHASVRANLAWMTPEASEAAMWDALRTASAEAFVRALPQGLETVVGDRGMRLSGGERQRIALARALLCDPCLLILDEATSHVDRDNERAILLAIENLRGRTTTLIVAHRPSALRDADRIVLLDRGQVVEQGTPDEIRDRPTGRLARWLAG